MRRSEASAMGGRDVNRTQTQVGPDERPRLSRGLLPGLLGYHLRRAQAAVFKDFGEVVGAEEGVTPGLFGMLQVIAANPGLAQSRLAEAMNVDRSTIVTVVDRLEDRGLVTRVPSRLDRRSHALHLTEAGRGALRRMEKLVVRHEAALTSVLTAEERETLIRLLVRLYERGDEGAGRAPGATRSTRSGR
jgi:DNA-binding MarR family transcriptional regulator